MKALLIPILLICSNFFMTFAWYGHLKNNSGISKYSLPVIILISWGIAFFEYCFMIPANHTGKEIGMPVAHLKIMQEVITFSVFIPFMIFYLKESWKWDYLFAMFCMIGAVYFTFRNHDEKTDENNLVIIDNTKNVESTH